MLLKSCSFKDEGLDEQDVSWMKRRDEKQCKKISNVKAIYHIFVKNQEKFKKMFHFFVACCGEG